MAKTLSHLTKLLNLVTQLQKTYGAELFHSPSGEAYFYAPTLRKNGDAIEVACYDSLPLRGDACAQYLRRQYFNAEGKGIAAGPLKDALDTIAGTAIMAGPQRTVYTRVAGFPDRVFLDLANADRQVVAVTEAGWNIGPEPADVRFVRRPGMLALPTPISTGEHIEDLIPSILNITDVRSQRLLVAWWLVALRGSQPFFILIIRGESGSAKTVGSNIIRVVVDPNEASTGSAPKDERDLMIAAQGCHVCAFDNISYVPEDLADALCRLATGSGMRTRRLHTDDVETIFKAARPILVNGIPDLLSRADLASRSLVIELDHISEEQRRTEADVYANVKVQQPKLLGALLDVLVASLRVQPTLKPTRLPRMADAALTVMSAEEALGWPSGTFVEMMSDTEEETASALLEGDPLYEVITNLQLPWAGELKDLLKHLPATDERGRPISAKTIGTRLRRLTGVLRKAGFMVNAPKGQEQHGALRGKRIWNVSSYTCDTSHPLIYANFESRRSESTGIATGRTRSTCSTQGGTDAHPL